MGNEKVDETFNMGFRFNSVRRGAGGEPKVEYASQSKVAMREIKWHLTAEGPIGSRVPNAIDICFQ